MIIQSLEKLIVNGRELSNAEVGKMDAEIERSRSAQKFGTERRARGMDQQEIAEHRKDQIAGRRAGPDSPWRQVMERYGFVWYEPEQLDKLLGRQVVIPKTLEGIPDPASLRARDVRNLASWFHRNHKEGQWRNDLHQQIPRDARLAFAEVDLLGLFAGPESFAKWIEEYTMELRMKRAGLVRVR